MTVEEVEIWLRRAESNLRIACAGREEGVFLEGQAMFNGPAHSRRLFSSEVYTIGFFG